RQQLRDDPRSVAVDDERGQAVRFGVHHAPRARVDAVAAPGGRGNALRPPRRIDGLFAAGEQPQPDLGLRRVERLAEELAFAVGDGDDAGCLVGFFSDVAPIDRSEEHTSELQSLAYLVCRLLLEKKNKKNTILSKL